ncbi:hypothetical protein AQUCO_00700728v1 [Aquilegia coerulea]|uniref:Leucine-rich repeat-containing N-terminal plant-type domain-containing protein n=1 Tax=Aquilegia coerulea TaxID=218851 RepID=A0A2G5ELE6_AQUCA|nr:hypothetical protein AQUCO_00700728v1 [Aquilegia coerulea]
MGYIHFILVLTFIQVHSTISVVTSNKRQAIEIIIGGGGIGIGGSGNTPTYPTDPTPPPAECSPPPSPPPPPADCSPPTVPPSPPPRPLHPPPKQPAPPPPEQPFNFLDERLSVAYPVIQNFKKIITSDPLGITKTWVGTDICNKYKGYYCDSPPDNVTAITVASIDFNGFHLSAPTLDGFLDKLPDLALFHANSNNFSGIISPKILKLRYLYELDLSNNKFSGAFPPALLAPNNITFLDIRFNFFSGSVPSQIFSRNLDVLFINNNNFKAKLPANIGTTSALFLSLANNKLTGQIPSSIGKALALIEILLLNNQLSGCLPYEIGYLEGLTLFDVGNNQLTGPLPCSFACLDKIEQLNLAGNFFYGPVPEVVCALGKLENLSLSGNYFTQVGPICRDLINRGVLDLKNNCVLDLPFQRSPMDCAMFFSRPRWCPFLQSYNFIPCKPSHSPHASTRQASYSGWKAPPLTHSSLIKHRL